MIHPTAIVDPEARLAPGVEVGPYAVIGAEVEVGAESRIDGHAVVQGPTIIGERNRIHSFAAIGSDPQDLKYQGERTTLEIGDDNTFRECCTINRGTGSGGGVTRIGNHNLIMAYVHVAHDCILGDHIILVNNSSLAGHVTVENHVTLGGFTLVSQFLTIGAYSFSTMGSAINKHVPPYIQVSGNLARAVSLNNVGLKRNGFGGEARQGMKQVFKWLFKGREPLIEVVGKIDRLAQQQPEVARMADFIRAQEQSRVAILR